MEMSSEHISNTLNEILPQSASEDNEETTDVGDGQIVERWREFIRSSSQTHTPNISNMLEDVKLPNFTTPEIILNNPLYKLSKLYKEDSEMVLLPFASGILLALLCTVLFKGSMVLLLLASLVILFIVLHRISKSE